MTLQCFVCASKLFPDDPQRDEQLHMQYVEAHKEGLPRDGVQLTVIQNGCEFPTPGVEYIRNPIVKNVAYNWLLCDWNCRADYWLFLPEDCRVTPHGWEVISAYTRKQRDCFALSRDPKALIGRKGIFRDLPKAILTLCDMNFLGKELGCVILREELERRDLHCLTKNWKKMSVNPDLWGNELYGEMNLPDHPNICTTLKQPVLQDYGFDGWKATRQELETTFMDIVSKSLERQRQDADTLKGMIAQHGPLISEVPFKGVLGEIKEWIRKR